MKADKKIGFIAGSALFIAYFFLAARPVPLESVLIPCWLNSIETGTPVYLGGSPDHSGDQGADSPVQRIPFSLGNRFGYVSRDGLLSVNQVKKANVSLSRERWAEYEEEPSRIAIYDNGGEQVAVIENPRGYPFFLDGRTFLIGAEQNAISAIDESGAVAWTYEFAGPLTDVDSAAGLLLVGSLDGMAGLLDRNGKLVFSFYPGGSQYSVILGCAIARDGSRLALISGIDDQRFLVLERFGSSADYKVVYHEFLGDSFRRKVYISFVEDDRWIVFERSGGLGFYDISSRKSGKIELNGEVCAIDHSGGKGMVFAVISRSGSVKELVGIRLPDGRVIIESPFKSEEVFLGRMDSRLIAGGGQILASFDLEKR